MVLDEQCQVGKGETDYPPEYSPPPRSNSSSSFSKPGGRISNFINKHLNKPVDPANRPDPSRKWGGFSSAARAGQDLTQEVLPDYDEATKPPPKREEDYTPEEQAKRAKQRKKGINPDLYAEVKAARKTGWNKGGGIDIGGGDIM